MKIRTTLRGGTMTFQVGDKVAIHSDQEWAKKFRGLTGTVEGFHKSSVPGGFMYYVKWPRELQTYSIGHDLHLVYRHESEEPFIFPTESETAADYRKPCSSYDFSAVERRVLNFHIQAAAADRERPMRRLCKHVKVDPFWTGKTKCGMCGLTFTQGRLFTGNGYTQSVEIPPRDWAAMNRLKDELLNARTKIAELQYEVEALRNSRDEWRTFCLTGSFS